MSGNGSNDWNVGFSHISWLERFLKNHGNVSAMSRHHDLVFDITRRKQNDLISIVCLNEYTMSLTATQRVLQEFGKPAVIYIGGGWCGYTLQAKEFCLREQIGLYVTDEMTGALWANDYWAYSKFDKDGHPIYHISREGA